MSSYPQTVQQEHADLIERLLSFELVRLAQQFAAQSGEECPRPVPKQWMEKAFAAHQHEHDLTFQMLVDYRESIAPDPPEPDPK